MSIDYAFRPRLRIRLTLRRKSLRRNPWACGVRFFTRIIVTHVSIRTSDISSKPSGSPSQTYGTLLYHVPLRAHPQLRSNAYPRYIFRAGRLDQ